MSSTVEAFTLTKRFGSQAALVDVSLSVQAGEFFTLLGPSGCGKTTLLRLIAGLERPDAGRIYLGGQEVTHLPAYRRPVHTVFQSYALFPHLTAFDNIAFGLARKGYPAALIRRRVQALLVLVGLEGIEHRYPHQLSGGQQQRVALARALACEPPVLLLDEPLAALDPHLRRQMQRELKGLQRQLGTTFILVTHDQDEALTLSDHIAVMRSGRIVQTGPPKTLYDAPKTAFVASFIGDCNLLRGTVRSRHAQVTVILIAGQPTQATCTAYEPDIGQQVLVAVRPELICLESADCTTQSGLTGRIIEWTYAGADTRWTVSLPDGQVVVATLRDKAAKTWEKGTPVQVTWWHDQATVVPPDEPEDDQWLSRSGRPRPV